MCQDVRERESNRRDFLTAGARGLALALTWPGLGAPAAAAGGLERHSFEPIRPPDWVLGVTRLAFVTPGEVDKAARAGVQVVHSNAVWPYFPLRRDGGGLTREEDRLLGRFVADCHRRHMKLVLGLPPFPPVALVKQHPQWRIYPDNSGSILKVVPENGDLASRSGCNLGPWGDYLIEVCAELVRDYHVDGFSFDGNYHPPICYCPTCKDAYRNDRHRELPGPVVLDDLAYRQYLVWRGERLEDHYRRMQQRLKQVNPEAVLMSWTVNAGRYGHLLQSPRAMPTRLNLLFDLPMQEWWLDETNLGGSVAPAFGAAYLRAVSGGHPCASEAYPMSRGQPYSTDSFPVHERLTRNLLALASGNVTAASFNWPGLEQSAEAVFRQTREREPWLTRTAPLPWAALLVSEQTRQFYAYKDIADRYLPHVFGSFRCSLEEHWPLTLINDWDLDPAKLAPYAVVLLANAAALSDAQAAAVREYVRSGGSLVATGESSLFDELGRPRHDFALKDLFGVSYQGRPGAPEKRARGDRDRPITVDGNYWQHRTQVAHLTWSNHPLVHDPRLRELVPRRTATFRGPVVQVSCPNQAREVGVWMTPEGWHGRALPAAILRSVGKGRVAYFAAAVDAALWSYAYPYQRRLLALALAWAAREPAPMWVTAPMCVQASYFVQAAGPHKRIVVHLFNGLNTTANHGLPAMDVPLREETVAIHGIKLGFVRDVPKSVHVEPGHRALALRQQGSAVVADLPPLDVHAVIVGESGGG